MIATIIFWTFIIACLFVICFIIKDGFEMAKKGKYYKSDPINEEKVVIDIDYYYLFKAPRQKSYKAFHKENEAISFSTLNPTWKVTRTIQGKDWDTLIFYDSKKYFKQNA